MWRVRNRGGNLFGGSDIVMVFERESNVNITAQVGVHYPIRSMQTPPSSAKSRY